MKKRIVIVACGVLLALAGCGSESAQESGLQKEPISVSEQTTEKGETTSGEQIAVKDEPASAEHTKKASADVITQDQALDAIRNYCYENNPDLEEMENSEEVSVYFDVSTNDADEIVVLYRSYTGAQIRYYVNPTSGEVYVTELVPGILDEEQKTDESFNIRDYIN